MRQQDVNMQCIFEIIMHHCIFAQIWVRSALVTRTKNEVFVFSEHIDFFVLLCKWISFDSSTSESQRTLVS